MSLREFRGAMDIASSPTLLIVYPAGWLCQRRHEWGPLSAAAAEAGLSSVVAEWDGLAVSAGVVTAANATVRMGRDVLPQPADHVACVPTIIFSNWGVSWEHRALFEAMLEVSNAMHMDVPAIAWLDGKCEFEACLRRFESGTGRTISRPRTTLSSEVHEGWAGLPDEAVIVKPSRSGQCRGIEIVSTSLLESRARESLDGLRDPFVAQRLIDDVFLFEGRRWDVRICALVTSLFPARALIGHEGVAKTAAAVASSGSIDLDQWLNADSHLGVSDGMNHRMSDMLVYFERAGTPLPEFWTRVDAIVRDVVESLGLFASEHECDFDRRFLVLGFDFIVERSATRGFEVQLLEMNTNPGMGWDSKIAEALVPHYADWFRELRAVAGSGRGPQMRTSASPGGLRTPALRS